MRHRLALIIPLLLALLLGPVAGAAPATSDADRDDLELLVLSNRADLVSGGDALVEVVLPDRAEAASVVIDVDGRDVSDAFAVRDDGRLYGRIEGLAVGDSTVTATLPDGRGARITITNHPIEGPVFAGPQVQPWICQTEQSGLGPAQDPSCHVPEPKFEFFYKPAGSTRVGSFDPAEFESYDPDEPPSEEDIASTTTDTGETVPYIVRRERGTIDRAIYDVLVLWDPDAPAWEPWQPHRGWNGKLLYHFGGGLEPNHEQGQTHDVLGPTAEPNTLGAGEFALSRGFAVATSTLNMLGNNINDVVSAEAMSMVKEHFAEAYGVPRYTLGQGCSGGSMQQHLIAANYPGLLDGIQPACSFSDSWTAINEVVECDLLQRYFTETSPELWSVEDQQAEVMGKTSVVTCAAWAGVNRPGYAEWVEDPSIRCTVGGDPDFVYRAQENPEGVRCTFQDYQQAVFGQRPREAWGPVEQQIGRGFAPRPLDNVGLQYGLEALEAGTILPEQFVDLNDKVGGFDIDYQYERERVAADPGALETVYRSGRVISGSQLATVPIIDYRGSANDAFHDNYRTYSTKERLLAANGHADNHVAFIDAGPLVPHPEMKAAALLALDEWVAAIKADTSDAPLAAKVVDNRPEGLTDTCWLPGDQTTSSDPAVCQSLYPSFGNARTAAGGPLADDIMKCELQPLDRADYAVSFTDAQWDRLQTAFPDGVCDWTQPGVAQQPPVGAWLTFAAGPGGEPLGGAPVSVPFEAPPRSGDPSEEPSGDPSERPGGPSGAPGSPVRDAIAAPGDAVLRLAGPGRVQTAVELSREAFPDGAERVVLARADDYPDALTAGALAAEVDGPVLLTGSDRLSAQTAAELDRLGAASVYLAGGEQALAAQVADDAGALGAAVQRLGGADRFDTAALIAREIAELGGPVDQAIIARADDYPDALAAGALAATGRAPILLTATDRLPDTTMTALDEVMTGDRVLVAGGTAAVGPDPQTRLADAGYQVTRLSGADRYATAVALADEAVAQGAGREPTLLASGTDFPDALAAVPASHALGGTLLLVHPQSIDSSPATRDYLTAHADAIDTAVIAGGTQAVSQQVHDQVTALITDP